MAFDFTTLKRDGIIKIDNFIDVNPYVNEFNQAIKTSTTDYPPGGMARIPRENFTSIPTIIKIFKADDFKQVADAYLGPPVDFLLQIFMTHEQKILDKKQWSRNNYAHIDPFRALKFLLFLTDVTKESGAFCCVPGTQEIGKKLRLRNSVEQNLSSNTYTLAAHSDFAYLEDQMIPMEGKAGMLLIMDTDMIHGGGVILRDGLERKVINAHCRKQ